MRLTFACVRMGKRYGPEYVTRLCRGIARHMPSEIPYSFTCLTDQPEQYEGVLCVRPPVGLQGWWAKLALFMHAWRSEHRVVYLDLDTVPIGPLRPLIAVSAPFAICENFTRLAGHPTWPCKYGSCVMVLNPSYGGKLWHDAKAITDDPEQFKRFERYGDQHLIEACDSDAVLLQRHLPAGFFVNYRHLPLHVNKPRDGSLIIFGGSHKPHNCATDWVRKEWVT